MFMGLVRSPYLTRLSLLADIVKHSFRLVGERDVIDLCDFIEHLHRLVLLVVRQQPPTSMSIANYI